MRALALALLILPGAALAQETAAEARDRGFLQGLIEDQLSGAGRQVIIEGFSGALSSQARIEVMTIADDQGVWLTAEGLVLDWTRSALLSGRIEVQDLGATRITIARAPVAGDSGLPSPEAQPFALPELPVSVSLGQIRADEIVLGEALLGQEVRLSLTGSADLAGGEGTARVEALRLDGPEGRFELTAGYSNATEILALDLGVTEAPGGLADALIGLPGEPSLSLTVAGTGPISAYGADLTLATDGAERVTGRLDSAVIDGARDLALDLSGDITPLLAPAYRPFFGTSAELALRGARAADGALSLSRLEVTTQALTLSGRAEITPEGWPSALELTGQLGLDGAPVVLPVGGEGLTTVASLDLALRHDASEGEGWSTRLTLRDLQTPGLRVAELRLDGTGTISPGAEGSFGGDLTYGATGLAPEDPGLARALGPDLTGRIRFGRTGDGPFRLDLLDLDSAGLTARAEGALALGEDLLASGSVTLSAGDLARLSDLAGLPGLAGRGALVVVAQGRPLAGSLDLILSGSVEDLRTGIAPLDGFLDGPGQVTVQVARDTEGTRIEALSLATAAVDLQGSAELRTGAILADLALVLPDLAPAGLGLSGPARLSLGLQPGDGAIDVMLAGDTAYGAIAASGQVAPDGSAAEGSLTAEVPDLAVLGRALGQDLGGAARLEISGQAAPTLGTLNLRVDAATQDLRAGPPQIAPLMAGAGALTLRLVRDAAGVLDLSELRLTTPLLEAVGYAGLNGAEMQGEVIARMAEVAAFLPGLRGPASLNLSGARRADGALSVTGSAETPAARLVFSAETPAGAPLARLTAVLSATELAPFSGLVGADLSGALDLMVRGEAAPDGSAFDLNVSGTATNLSPGSPTLARLLAGQGTFGGRFARNGGAGITVEGLALTFPNLTARLSLSGAGGAGEARFEARLADLGLFAPDFPGPATATGTARRGPDGSWGVTADLTAPGDSALRLTGSLSPALRPDLRLTGTVPLGFANAALEPRRISGRAGLDLRLTEFALSGLTGRLTPEGARLTDPALGLALNDLGGEVRLGGGRATVDLSAGVESGGALRLTGDVGLSAPYPADLRLQAEALGLRDPALYETTATGEITLTGGLLGGGQVAGTLRLGPTELRIPSSGIGALGDLPAVTHLAPPAPVVETLARAGLAADGAESAGGGGGSGALTLDLTIEAPSQVFVRGRGLDAELGGTLRLTGTTARLIPSGGLTLIRGRLDILGQRFALTEGEVRLAGDFTPDLTLVAQTTARTGTAIAITMSGPVDSPEVTFASVPALPQDEVLAQLLFGQDLSQISPLQAVQLAAAIGTLAGRGGAGLIDGLRSDAGLDDLDITTDAAGNAELRLGKYLTENLYTDVTIGTETSEATINLDLTTDLTLRGAVSSDGDTSLGIFFERDY